MRRVVVSAIVYSSLSVFALAQASDADVTFEVASVKPSGPLGPGAFAGSRGGPGTADPGRIQYSRVPLKRLLMDAYGVQDHQIIGPSWLESELYDVDAKLPPDTGSERFKRMLINMLNERFNINLHKEAREFSGYRLVVAKGGSKLTPLSAPPALVPESDLDPGKKQKNDPFPTLPPGNQPAMAGSTRNRVKRVAARMTTTEGLAGFLEHEVGLPVVDRSGLSGSYDFRLEFSTEGLGGAMYVAVAAAAAARQVQGLPPFADDGGPTLFLALERQLGLQLESSKVSLMVLVVDRANKVPTAN
jgi:uncharacterized protein (TIGR03435 family)